MNGNRIILAAHRGDCKACPENTMPAFGKAIAFGVDMIETDVHMTRDGELIIMHDRNTARTTGHDGLTDQMTLAEIKALDAGGWFSEAFKNTSVPTVKEFIERIKNTQILINWELKDYPSVVGDDFAFGAADKLIALQPAGTRQVISLSTMLMQLSAAITHSATRMVITAVHIIWISIMLLLISAVSAFMKQILFLITHLQTVMFMSAVLL